MSMHRRLTGQPVPKPDYSDGMTKQSFKDQCDINKILKKAEVAGGLSHVQKYDAAVYGEFDGEFDLLTANARIQKANEIFNDLPAEVRSEFQNNALAFVKFAADPANNDRLVELIPAIAEPGRYFPNAANRFGKGAGAATVPDEVVNAEAPKPASSAPSAPLPADED